MVGRLRLYGGVRVARAGAFCIIFQGGQVVRVGSPQDPVPGDTVILWVVPGEGQAVMADLGGSKACGHCRRVVLDGVIGFSWGCATGDGSCPISVLAQCLDRIVVGRLRLYGDVGIVRAGASRVGLDGVQAVGVGSSLDPVPGYVRVLGVVPG